MKYIPILFLLASCGTEHVPKYQNKQVLCLSGLDVKVLITSSRCNASYADVYDQCMYYVTFASGESRYMAEDYLSHCK